jgi:two-component system LytT family response regulator
MRVVIADDEPLARCGLARLCKESGGLDVVAEAASGAEAIHAIQAYRPDLVLLDVELQDMTGFEVLAALHGNVPSTIFVTGHREHALQAFAVEALDFLTKPVDESRFEAAIDRARHRHPQALAAELCELTTALQATLDLQARTASPPSHLLAEKAQRLHFIDTTLIESIESDCNYAIVHTESERYIARATITRLATTLAPLGFLRIDRSLLINLRRVAFMEKLSGYYAFTLRSGRRLVSGGVTYRKEIHKALRQMRLEER